MSVYYKLMVLISFDIIDTKKRKHTTPLPRTIETISVVIVLNYTTTTLSILSLLIYDFYLNHRVKGLDIYAII